MNKAEYYEAYLQAEVIGAESNVPDLVMMLYAERPNNRRLRGMEQILARPVWCATCGFHAASTGLQVDKCTATSAVDTPIF